MQIVRQFVWDRAPRTGATPTLPARIQLRYSPANRRLTASLSDLTYFIPSVLSWFGLSDPMLFLLVNVYVTVPKANMVPEFPINVASEVGRQVFSHRRRRLPRPTPS